MATQEVLLSLVTPIVDEVGAELYDLDYSGGVLKVIVTKPEGIDLDTIGDITQRISRQLDLDDPIAGRYTLEVSSPGLERTLRLPAHWSSAVGEWVRVKLKPHTEGERRFVGTVTSATETTATLDVDGTSVEVSLDDIDRARTVFVWGGQEKPGQKKGANKGGAGAKGTSDELDPDIRAALAGDDDADDGDLIELDGLDDEGDFDDDFDEDTDGEDDDLADDEELSDPSDPDNESENP